MVNRKWELHQHGDSNFTDTRSYNPPAEGHDMIFSKALKKACRVPLHQDKKANTVVST